MSATADDASALDGAHLTAGVAAGGVGGVAGGGSGRVEAVAGSPAASPPVASGTPMLGVTPPLGVTEVTGEILPGSESTWQPGSYAEWESRTRLTTVLEAWSAQMADERALRRKFAGWIFALITLQIAGAFGLVIGVGLNGLRVDPTVMKILLPSVFAEVFGLGLLVTKYLFSLPARQSLDGLAQGGALTPTSAGPASGGGVAGPPPGAPSPAREAQPPR